MAEHEKGALDYIDECFEIKGLTELFEDEALDQILNDALKLIVKPAVPHTTANNLMVQFQAMSAKYHLIAKHYQIVAPGKSGTVEYKKKNAAYSISECCDSLAAVMKILVRSGV